jgi:cytochrome c553
LWRRYRLESHCFLVEFSFFTATLGVAETLDFFSIFGGVIMKIRPIVRAVCLFALLPVSGYAANTCHVDYSFSSEWNTGFTASVNITNTGDAWSSWQATWHFDGSQQITGLWNGQHSQSGSQVNVQNASWNGQVGANQTVNFGFNGSHQGANPIPTNITVNGTLCTGQPEPEPEQPEEPVTCEANYNIREQWSTGFTADVMITNTGRDWNNWQVEWSMPNGQVVTHAWNSVISQNGDAVQVSPVSWNANITKDAVLSFGFNGTRQGPNPVPTDIKVNGILCDGQPEPEPAEPISCQVSYDIREQWNTGFTADVVITNTGRDWYDWQVEWSMPNGQVVTNAWNSVINQNGTAIQATSPGWNTEVLKNAALSFGFNGTHNGTNEIPTDVRVDGVFCAGQNEVPDNPPDRTEINVRLLAGTCASCHGPDGSSAGPGIPTIAGLNVDYFIQTMQTYQTDERASTIMGRVSRGYTDEHISALAEHYATLPFVHTAEQSTDEQAVQQGRIIHQARCTVCHADAGRATGLSSIPLASQWSPYLEATLEDYWAGRSTDIPTLMAQQLIGIKQEYGDQALYQLAQFYAADTTEQEPTNPTDPTDPIDPTDPTDPTDPDDSTVPTTPANLHANVLTNNQVQLTWQDQSDDETGFRLSRLVGDHTEWQTLADLNANTQSYTDNAVAAGTSYQYRLVALNDHGASNSVETNANLLSEYDYGASLYMAKACAACHGADGGGGFTNVALTGYTQNHASMLSQTTADTMPPSAPGDCTGSCADAITTYIIQAFADGGDDGGIACSEQPPAGERGLRLLTRREYQNTVQDLLGLTVNIVHQLPTENRVRGFANNSTQNRITDVHVETYLNMAEDLAQQALTANQAELMSCNESTSACINTLVNDFGQDAFRRPLSASEQQTYAGFFSGRTLQDGMSLMMTAMLSSPHFLYRSELGELQEDSTYQLTDYELATALSYLFLGSMPDDELMSAAQNGALQDATGRIEQAARLLALPKSRAWLGQFAGEWLLADDVYTTPGKDMTTYPNYTDAIRQRMAQEVVNFFNHVVFDSTQTYQELISADYVLADQTLAGYYGLSASGGNVQMVPAQGTRFGALTLGSVMARYANTNESHPFKRGSFFLDRILCQDLPEPGNMGVMPPAPDPNLTTRERFAAHSQSDTSCFECHQYLDGPGFAFENYDGAGGYRANENGQSIDTSGVLRGLETFQSGEQIPFGNFAEMNQILVGSTRGAECMATQYYRFATGREESGADQCELSALTEEFVNNGSNLQTLILGIVNSRSFTHRRVQ